MAANVRPAWIFAPPAPHPVHRLYGFGRDTLPSAAGAGIGYGALTMPLRWLTGNTAVLVGGKLGYDTNLWNVGVDVAALGVAQFQKQPINALNMLKILYRYNATVGFGVTRYFKQLLSLNPDIPPEWGMTWSEIFLEGARTIGQGTAADIGAMGWQAWRGWQILFGVDLYEPGILRGAFHVGVGVGLQWAVAGLVARFSRRSAVPATRAPHFETGTGFTEWLQKASFAETKPAGMFLAFVDKLVGNRILGEYWNSPRRKTIMAAWTTTWDVVWYVMRSTQTIPDPTAGIFDRSWEYAVYRAPAQSIWHTLADILIWGILSTVRSMQQPDFSLFSEILKFMNPAKEAVAQEAAKSLPVVAKGMWTWIKEISKETLTQSQALLKTANDVLIEYMPGFELIGVGKLVLGQLLVTYFIAKWRAGTEPISPADFFIVDVLVTMVFSSSYILGPLIAVPTGILAAVVYAAYQWGIPALQWASQKTAPPSPGPKFIGLPTLPETSPPPALDLFKWALVLENWKTLIDPKTNQRSVTAKDFSNSPAQYLTEVLLPIEKLLWNMVIRVIEILNTVNATVPETWQPNGIATAPPKKKNPMFTVPESPGTLPNPGESREWTEDMLWLAAVKGNYAIVVEVLASAYRILSLLFTQRGEPPPSINYQSYAMLVSIPGINAAVDTLSTSQHHEVEHSCVLAVLCLRNVGSSLDNLFLIWGKKIQYMPFEDAIGLQVNQQEHRLRRVVLQTKILLEADMWKTSLVDFRLIDQTLLGSSGLGLIENSQVRKELSSAESWRALMLNRGEALKFSDALRPVIGQFVQQDITVETLQKQLPAVVNWLRLHTVALTVHSGNGTNVGVQLKELEQKLVIRGKGKGGTLEKRDNLSKDEVTLLNQYIDITNIRNKAQTQLITRFDIRGFTDKEMDLAENVQAGVTAAAVHALIEIFSQQSFGGVLDADLCRVEPNWQAVNAFIRFYFETMYWTGTRISDVYAAWVAFHTGSSVIVP